MTPDKIYSVPDRVNSDRHKIRYPAYTEIVVDEKRHIIKLINPDPKKRNFYLMAPSEEIMEKVLKKMTDIMAAHIKQNEESGSVVPALEDTPEEGEGLNDDFESLIDFPVDGSLVTIFFFIILYPFAALMHFTVPDVRTLDIEGNPNSTLGKASLACFSCLIWLIVGSYAMVASLEALAGLMDIPDAVVGYTVSAAGTSLPNYVASAVAARNGFGNMAVSNALGSNTFNIMVALGLPWLLYTSFGTGFEPYNELRNEGITEGVLILAAVLLLLVLLLLQSGFVLHIWHGHLFVACYIAYLVYVIGGVYWW
uniref:Sodium/calcium exchanger membrane region domain-containing protein n=1 Tax=Entomoneis paludosa TaxID=265537 RepID=A0A7S2Y1K3_9STRA